MKFELNRQQLYEISQLMKPVITAIDFKSITDSVLFKFKNGILHLQASGESNLIEAKIPVDIPESFSFLTSAALLFHILATSSVETLKFELTGDNPACGEGLLKITGNSVVKLPLRNCERYPEFLTTFPDFHQVSDNLVDDLFLAAEYVDRNSFGFRSGVFASNKHLLATCGSSILFRETSLPISQFLFPPNSFRPLRGLKNLTVAELPKLLLFNGNLGEIEVNVGILPINDKYPYEEYLSKALEFEDMPGNQFILSKANLESALRRISGFLSAEYNQITLQATENIFLKYAYKEYEFEEKVQGKADSPQQFSLDFRRFREFTQLCATDVKFKIITGKNLLLMRTDRDLYLSSIIIGG